MGAPTSSNPGSSSGGSYGGGKSNPSAGAAMPGFQEGFQMGDTDVNGNPLTAEQKQFVGGIGNAMTGIGRGLGQAFGAGNQPGQELTTQQFIGGLGNAMAGAGLGLGQALGARLPGQNPSASIGMPVEQPGGFGGGKSAGGMGDVLIRPIPGLPPEPETGGPLPLPGQNPSVGIGMPVEQQQVANIFGTPGSQIGRSFQFGYNPPRPGFRPDTRGPGGFGNDFYGNPIGSRGMPLQMTMASSRPAGQPQPMPQSPNRFIPPNAPGASARRVGPTPGTNWGQMAQSIQERTAAAKGMTLDQYRRSLPTVGPGQFTRPWIR